MPWHLTTREAMTEVRRVLAAEGVYVANLIDNGPLAFARSSVATLRDRFDHVALTAPPGTLCARAAATWSPSPPMTRSTSRRSPRGSTIGGPGWEVITGAELDAWVGDAQVLTDDHAPVDQLLTPHVEPAS